LDTSSGNYISNSFLADISYGKDKRQLELLLPKHVEPSERKASGNDSATQLVKTTTEPIPLKIDSKVYLGNLNNKQNMTLGLIDDGKTSVLYIFLSSRFGKKIDLDLKVMQKRLVQLGETIMI